MDEQNQRRVTREELSKVFPTHKLIKAFEKLLKVADATPDEITAVIVLAETAQEGADTAQATAMLAHGVADLALAVAAGLSEGPTPLHLQLAQQVDDLTGQLSAATAQIHELTRRVADIEERPIP